MDTQPLHTIVAYLKQLKLFHLSLQQVTDDTASHEFSGRFMYSRRSRSVLLKRKSPPATVTPTSAPQAVTQIV